MSGLLQACVEAENLPVCHGVQTPNCHTYGSCLRMANPTINGHMDCHHVTLYDYPQLCHQKMGYHTWQPDFKSVPLQYRYIKIVWNE